MKKSVIILLHLGYWFLYFLLLFFISAILTNSVGGFFFTSWKGVVFFSVFAIIPGLITFYSFYGPLFTRFLSRKRFLVFFTSGIGVTIGSGLLGYAMLYQVWDSIVPRAERERPVLVRVTGLTLTVNEPEATYQWFTKDSAISGANSRSYEATQSGKYAVLVTKNGRTDTSALRDYRIASAASTSSVPSNPYAYKTPAIDQGGWGETIGLNILMMINALLNGILGLVMRGFITSYGDIDLKDELTKKNYDMELALVKSQLNPHFLFNTINNIDVLISRDAQQASAYLNKLSDIMRFMLYETKSEEVLLETELLYIGKYIDLQKIRSANPRYVSYEVLGDPAGLVVAPMLFLPFIENAFKHAENKKIENAIRIRFDISQQRILFACENHYNPLQGSNLDHGGLGNGLIVRRLELLYPQRHRLQIGNAGNLYTVELSIDTHAADMHHR